MSMKKERAELIALCDEAIEVAECMRGRAWTQKWSYQSFKKVEETIHAFESARSLLKSIPKKPDAHRYERGKS